MADCWARFTKTCSGKMSLEHAIPQVLFRNTNKTSEAANIFVVRGGYPGAMEEEQVVPLSRAGTRILCKKHNNELGILDAEVAKIKTAVEAYCGLLSRASNITEIPVELLTRWLCKTHCNHIAIHKLPFNRSIASRALGCPGGEAVCMYAIITSEENVSKNRGRVVNFRSYVSDDLQLSITRIFGHAFLLSSLNYDRTATVAGFGQIALWKMFFSHDQETLDWLASNRDGILLIPPPFEIPVSGRSPFTEPLDIGSVKLLGAGNSLQPADRAKFGATLRIG